jgi:PhzF family phenazine biosynthesis protein
VFDLTEELPFAGHPLIGAAAVLHHLSGDSGSRSWRFVLPARTVTILTDRAATGYFSLLEQGRPAFRATSKERSSIAKAFSLGDWELDQRLPLEVVDAGLAYLVVPLLPGALERARISRDITELLRPLGAQFAVLLDEAALEIRHWNNDGILEDVATGSAAGAIGAYRLRHGLTSPDHTFTLAQGRFTGRPSQLGIKPEGTSADVTNVSVGGHVAFVGRGCLEVLP